MESIFKALSKEYNSVKDNPDVAVAEKRELLEEIVKYVNSMTWLSRKATKEKISFYIKSGYDYDALCKEFDITYEAAKNAVKWASKQLKSKTLFNLTSIIQVSFVISLFTQILFIYILTCFIRLIIIKFIITRKFIR